MCAAKKTDAEETSPTPEQLAAATSVLVVDNDKSHAQAMKETLSRVGYRCTVATSGPDGAKAIELNSYDIIITDLMMNEVDGMQILAHAKELLPECMVIMVTGHASVPRAVEAMQLGAFNFLEKPLNLDRLRAVTLKAAEAVALRRRNVDLQQRLDEKFGFEKIIYASSQMEAVIDRVKRIAPTDASVLITGETGTGKELIAEAIHQNSPRKKKPFVPLNCAALSEHLLESELFGHTRGAFTDAASDRMGRFEYAHGGTLFFDEVGDMPMPTQIKLLRVLENGEITRIGENKPISINVRVLSATHKDLTKLIETGDFREDLYHRLKVVSVHLPALCDRRDDIIPLADHFRKTCAKRHGKTVKGISTDASRQLLEYEWPGNVRQLQNVIDNMVIFDVDEVLGVDDLPDDPFGPQATEVTEITGDPGPLGLIGKPMTEIEKWAIQQTLKLAGGNREETAKMLGIGARTLYRKIKEYNLKEKE